MAGTTCDVWWARPHAVDEVADLLSYGERQRAASIRDGAEKARFATGRALLRLLLAERLYVQPSFVPIGYSCRVCGGRHHGKPLLLGVRARDRFSIAHAGGRVGVALTTARSVGIDVEVDRDPGDPQRLALARLALSPTERPAYERLPAVARGRAMTLWWARKEAVLKATGDGLAISPAAVLVSGPDRPPALLGWDGRRLAESARGKGFHGPAQLQDLTPGVGYVASVAVLGPAPVVVIEHDGDAVLTRAARQGVRT
jgi:4'-phosphopantetheinyl transferase